MKGSKKGMSDYISHILVLVVAIVVLSIIGSTMHEFYVDLTLESQRSQSASLSRKIRNGILDMYSEHKGSGIMPDEGKSEVLFSAVIDTPERIGRSSYDIYLNTTESDSPVEIVLKTTSFPRETYRYDIYNIDVNVTGKVANPEGVRLEYIRKNQGGSAEDLIRMSRAN